MRQQLGKTDDDARRHEDGPLEAHLVLQNWIRNIRLPLQGLTARMMECWLAA
jgi:hypothetical protein